LAFFFDVQEKYDENPFLKSIFNAIDSRTKDDKDVTTLALQKFFSDVDMTEFWSYEGSLT
jgi:carbonic anhydrase